MLHVIRHDIIKMVYVPNSSYDFPFNHDYGKQRRLSCTWLIDYSTWLVYSKVLDGGFCLPCLLFDRPVENVRFNFKTIKYFQQSNREFS